MRQRVFPIPLLAFLLLFAWNASAAPPDVGTLDWSVKAPHNLAANRPSDDEILALDTQSASVTHVSLICVIRAHSL